MIKSWHKVALLTLGVLFGTFGTSPPAFAQENASVKYKVGQRVECDPNWGKYYKGTIASVAREDWMYRVKFDYDGTSDTLNLELPCLVKQMRPLQASEKNTPKTDAGSNAGPRKQDRPGDFTYLADREILECPIEQTQARNGAAPNGELLKKVIRCLYERRAPAGMTGAKTVDVTAFQIGAVRKWRPLDDIGSGKIGTNVYPIKVSWTEKTFYESYTQQIDSISIFNCYINAVGEWECGLGQRIKDGEIKRIPRPE